MRIKNQELIEELVKKSGQRLLDIPVDELSGEIVNAIRDTNTALAYLLDGIREEFDNIKIDSWKETI